jgi:hypothetical protein
MPHRSELRHEPDLEINIWRFRSQPADADAGAGRCRKSP